LTGLLNGLETKTFDLDGQKYDIQNYLLRVKNKINRSTEEQLKTLQTNIHTTEQPKTIPASTVASAPSSTPTTTPDTEKTNIDVIKKDDYEYPVPGVKINSPYGPRWGKQHKGIDIAAAK
jgi:murein DD-endopeptidase MepM/ murein hydrolase activator NlpD